MHMKRRLFIFIFYGVLGICLVNEVYAQKVETKGGISLLDRGAFPGH